MKNIKELNLQNLHYNLSKFKDKKICAMVKANAYGHGLKEIVRALEDDVFEFGVVSVEEGRQIRKFTDKPVLICSKIDSFPACKNLNLQFIVEDEADIKSAVLAGAKNLLNLKINCGMNRYGTSSVISLKNINKVLEGEGINLRSICSHFPATENPHLTKQNYKNFLSLRKEISQKAEICLGGSGVYGYNFAYQILRLGIGLYGYEGRGLKPVMRICSYVKKVIFVPKGQYVGYGRAYKTLSGGYYAIVPVGYADGLRRNLSGKFKVRINKKFYPAVGNICMDCFFVKVDQTVRVGEEVVVMSDAEEFSKTCGTISYEILTGFSNFRGKTKICSDKS